MNKDKKESLKGFWITTAVLWSGVLLFAALSGVLNADFSVVGLPASGTFTLNDILSFPLYTQLVFGFGALWFAATCVTAPLTVILLWGKLSGMDKW